MTKIIVEVEVSDDPDYCGNCKFWKGSPIGHWCIITGWNSDQDGKDTMKQGWCRSAIEKAKQINYCSLCGDEIKFTGKYYEHVNTKPRHIASPKR
jgi:hypothetical protein